jgi:hypothetical protein
MSSPGAVATRTPTGSPSVSAAVEAEFDRQVENLVRKGYPRAARLTSGQFVQLLEPLRSQVREREPASRFVIVVKSGLVGRDEAIRRVERRGESGFTVLEPADLERFRPIAEVDLPDGTAYVASGLDIGGDTLNVTPEMALDKIEAAGRSPLTIDEGIALVTHDPEALAKNAGFSLAGSRCGDRRVCALWISKGKPKLGWCWAGNPHTWLGTASCAGRAGA